MEIFLTNIGRIEKIVLPVFLESSFFSPVLLRLIMFQSVWLEMRYLFLSKPGQSYSLKVYLVQLKFFETALTVTGIFFALVAIDWLQQLSYHHK